MVQDDVALRNCLLMVEAKVNLGPIASWTDTSYKLISEQIQDSTNYSISTNTLKRLFGKVKTTETYKPQIETKNALAHYLGYKDWYNFLNPEPAEHIAIHTIVRPLPLESIPPTIEESNAEGNITKPELGPKYSKLQIWIGASIFAAVLIVTYFGIYNYLQKPPTLTGNKMVGTVPFTASFKYDVSQFEEKSTYIDFNELHVKNYLLKDSHLVMHRYQMAGYYPVILYNDKGKILTQSYCYAKSLGWQVLMECFGTLFPVKNPANPEIPNIYQGSNVPGVPVNLRTHYRNFDEFGIDADNFVFEADLKLQTVNSDLTCYSTKIKFYGAEGKRIEICLLQPDCYSSTYMEFGEVKLSGNFTDLPQFGQDLSFFRKVNISVLNKNVTVSIDGKQIFTVKYKNKMGSLKGLLMRFEGIGTAKNIRLSSPDGSHRVSSNF